MKTTLMTALLFAGLTFAGNSSEMLKVHLNQTTHIGTAVVPAGDYLIRSITGAEPMLDISSGKVHVIAQAMRVDDRSDAKTEILLERSGETFTMTKMHIEGSGESFELIQ